MFDLAYTLTAKTTSKLGHESIKTLRWVWVYLKMPESSDKV